MSRYIICREYFLSEDLWDNIQNEDVKIIKLELKKIKNIILKFCRYVHFTFSFPGMGVWFEDVKVLEPIIKDEKAELLLFDLVNIYHVKYLNKKIPTAKKNLWIWNPIEDNKKSFLKIRFFLENIYTFDRRDAELYRIKYYSQFYWRKKEDYRRNTDLKNSIFFIGSDKGRLEKLKFLKKELIPLEYTCKFYITPDQGRIYSKDDKIYLCGKGMSYYEVLKSIHLAKCLVDISKEGQVGLTVRVLESLFFGVKLITNNIDIINYDFYLKENILILTEKITNNDVEKFLSTPQKEVSKQVLEKYFYKEWLEKMFEK